MSPSSIRHAMINQPFGVRFRNLVDAYLIRPSAAPSITAFNVRYFFNEYPLITRISAGFKGHSRLHLSLTAAVTRRQMFSWLISPPQHSAHYPPSLRAASQGCPDLSLSPAQPARTIRPHLHAPHTRIPRRGRRCMGAPPDATNLAHKGSQGDI